MEYLKLLPKNILSRMVGKVMDVKHPAPLARAARDAFAKHYKINLAEAELPFDQYPSIGDLFTRKLKPGVRPIGKGLIVHPADSDLTQVETIECDTVLQAKGMEYSLAEFVKEPEAANIYSGGAVLTYYLCPTDYHRVHSPVDAEVSKIVHVPGTLWPVNDWSVKSIPKLFAVNERLIFHLDTPSGRVLLVMVGATNVGRMSVDFDSSIQTNHMNHRELSAVDYNPPHKIAKGAELGTFHMGSTVIVLYPAKMLSVLPSKGRVLVGQSV